MRVMSDFREAMWAVVQRGISTLDFDYALTPTSISTACWANAGRPTLDRQLGGCCCARGSHRVRDRARVVIVGGGVGGASIAYHLADRGERDVLLIERAELTSGSTFHSAGLVGQLRSTLPVTRMMMHSVELYRRLEADAATTGRSPGWREVGSLRIASTPARMEELRRQHGWATTFGLATGAARPDGVQGRCSHRWFPTACWVACTSRRTVTSTRAD